MKVGDTVKRTGPTFKSCIPRHTYQVAEIQPYAARLRLYYDGSNILLDNGSWFDPDYFAVVDTTPTLKPEDPMKYPTTSAERKAMPIYSGVVRYFPAALALVSVLSRKGNEKHNPGEPLHHARGKSTDHGDCIIRHQMEVGTIDPDTQLDHAVGVAWRALAQLQELAESKYGWPLAPGARLLTPEPQK